MEIISYCEIFCAPLGFQKNLCYLEKWTTDSAVPCSKESYVGKIACLLNIG